MLETTETLREFFEFAVWTRDMARSLDLDSILDLGDLDPARGDANNAKDVGDSGDVVAPLGVWLGDVFDGVLDLLLPRGEKRGEGRWESRCSVTKLGRSGSSACAAALRSSSALGRSWTISSEGTVKFDTFLGALSSEVGCSTAAGVSMVTDADPPSTSGCVSPAAAIPRNPTGARAPSRG